MSFSCLRPFHKSGMFMFMIRRLSGPPVHLKEKRVSSDPCVSSASSKTIVEISYGASTKALYQISTSFASLRPFLKTNSLAIYVSAPFWLITAYEISKLHEQSLMVVSLVLRS